MGALAEEISFWSIFDLFFINDGHWKPPEISCNIKLT